MLPIVLFDCYFPISPPYTITYNWKITNKIKKQFVLVAVYDNVTMEEARRSFEFSGNL
jgi:hypothetical protein